MGNNLSFTSNWNFSDEDLASLGKSMERLRKLDTVFLNGSRYGIEKALFD